MVGVGLDDTLEMAPRQDQQPVKTLGSDRSHPALGESVCSGCPDRRTDDLKAFAS